PRNFSDGGVLETSRMFQAAWAAVFMTPARSPTRGSGFGAVVDIGPAEVVVDDDDDAHPPRDTSPRASEVNRSGRIGANGFFMGGDLQREGRRAFSAFGQFRW